MVLVRVCFRLSQLLPRLVAVRWHNWATYACLRVSAKDMLLSILSGYIWPHSEIDSDHLQPFNGSLRPYMTCIYETTGKLQFSNEAVCNELLALVGLLDLPSLVK